VNAPVEDPVSAPSHDLCGWLNRECEELCIPGAAVTVSDGNGLSSAFAGRYQVDESQPIDDRAMYPLGCVAKLVTAVLVLRLCEEGRIELDTPLVEVLGPRISSRDVIRRQTMIGHLLSHTSGIMSSFETLAESPDEAAPATSEGEFIARLYQPRPPGAIFSYAHSPYALAGAVIETLTHRPWVESVRDLLLDELGGRFASEPEQAPCAHRWNGGVRPRPWPRSIPTGWSTVGNPATGNLAFTNSATLALFGNALLKTTEGARGRLLSDRSLELLRDADWRPVHGKSPFRGVGLREFSPGCYGHLGSIGGYNTLVAIEPERGLVVAVMVNANTVALAQRLVSVLMRTDLISPPWRDDDDRRYRPRQAYTGAYVNGNQTIEIGETRGQLTFLVGVDAGSRVAGDSYGRVRLVRMAEDVYVAPWPFPNLPGGRRQALVEFVPDDASASIPWIRVNELVYQRGD
jgi:CubicO group peptidase (beta-lactamase class C family)